MQDEKNRFSKLLTQLMADAEVKNYLLARFLQYDESYISKWMNGKVIPSEKNQQKVIEGISQYIAKHVSDEKLPMFMERYSIDDRKDLQRAIYDHLEIEYNYVHELQNTLNVSVAPAQRFFVELTLKDYIDKMHHPVLRRISSLDVAAAMDIFGMDKEYRWQIISFEGDRTRNLHQYPDVHFTMVLSLDIDRMDIIYDTIFLINMLSQFSQVNFKLFTNQKAAGKIIFSVRDDFAMGGMLVNKKKCVCIGMVEDPETSNILYDSVRDMINQDLLLFRETSILEMLENGEYIRSLISPNPRWIIGHIDENFLPTDVYEEVVQSLKDDPNVDPRLLSPNLMSSHAIARTLVDGSGMHMIIHEGAVSNFIATRELDFYDHKIILSNDQVSRVMGNIESMIQNNKKLKCQMILGSLVSDIKYYNVQNVYISDIFSYLRLSGGGYANNGKYILAINHPEVQAVFAKFFETIWNDELQTVVSDPMVISAYMSHMTERIEQMSRVDEN